MLFHGHCSHQSRHERSSHCSTRENFLRFMSETNRSKSRSTFSDAVYTVKQTSNCTKFSKTRISLCIIQRSPRHKCFVTSNQRKIEHTTWCISSGRFCPRQQSAQLTLISSALHGCWSGKIKTSATYDFCHFSTAGAKYVIITSAPALLSAVKLSMTADFRSRAPFWAPNQSDEYSPETWYTASGKWGWFCLIWQTMSRYGMPGLTINMSAPTHENRVSPTYKKKRY